MAHSTSTTHYELSQFASSDKPAWLVDYNGDMEKIDAGMYAASAKATAGITNFADAFDSEATYEVGDMVTYQNIMYKCIAAVTAAGPWNSNQWSAVTVADIAGTIEPVISDYDDLSDKPQINGVTLAGNKTGADLGLGLVVTDAADMLNLTSDAIAAGMVFTEKAVIKIELGSKNLYIIDMLIANPNSYHGNIATFDVTNANVEGLNYYDSYGKLVPTATVSITSGVLNCSSTATSVRIKGIAIL